MSIDLSAATGRRPGTSRYIAFFDECGDHSLTNIDHDFPVFVLSTVVVERESYVRQIVPMLGALKLRFFEHEGVNLHSRDIRKGQGDYTFLQVPSLRGEFLAISRLIRTAPFTLFIVGIRKDQHLAHFGETACSPYDLALEHTLEMLVHFLDGCGETHPPVVAEARGRNEDDQLRATFEKLLREGTAAAQQAGRGEDREPGQKPAKERRGKDGTGAVSCAHR